MNQVQSPERHAERQAREAARIEAGGLLRAEQAADYLGIQRNTIYVLAREGKIKALATGRHLKFDRADLKQYAEDEFKEREAARIADAAEKEKEEKKEKEPQRGPKPKNKVKV